MDRPWQAAFAFAVCQHGAEPALKRDLASRIPSLRAAFSRPGFVTFKLEQPLEAPEKFAIVSPFARTGGLSLGAVEGDRLHDLAQRLWEIPEVAAMLASIEIAGLHVWQRDASVPGMRGFEPGPTALAVEAEHAVRELSPVESLRSEDPAHRRVSPRNKWVLDVALVEPNHWWVGCHRTTNRTASWPGGVPPLALPPHAVSRAYLKMAEALAWSALPMSRGDQVVELGCAPGGAAQALLDSGLVVTGLDPAEVDETVLAHPRFTHVRARTTAAPYRIFRGVQWLAADMNVPPQYTLDAVEAAVTHPGVSIRGMLLTLKLADWRLADELSAYVMRVRSWGYKDVRLRQLAFNRQEICLAALRSRGQRRMLRTGARSSQHRGTPRTAPDASVPAPESEL